MTGSTTPSTPKAKKVYPASLSRCPPPAPTSPRGPNNRCHGCVSSGTHQSSPRLAERSTPSRQPSTRSNTSASSTSSTPSLHAPTIDHKSLKLGDIVKVYESAEYGIFKFVDSPTTCGATPSKAFHDQRQAYLAKVEAAPLPKLRPAMILEPDADRKHLVMLLTGYDGNLWESLPGIAQSLSVEVERAGCRPERKHSSELAFKMEGRRDGWRYETPSYMILHSRKLKPSSTTERGHVVKKMGFKLTGGAETLRQIMDLEKSVKKGWFEKHSQKDRDDMVAESFSCTFKKHTNFEAPSPRIAYSAPRVATPGGRILPFTPRSTPAATPTSSPRLAQRNLPF